MDKTSSKCCVEQYHIAHGFFLLDDEEENIFSSISGDVVFFGGGMQVITSAIVPLPSRICLVIGWYSSFLFCGGGGDGDSDGGGDGGVANVHRFVMTSFQLRLRTGIGHRAPRMPTPLSEAGIAAGKIERHPYTLHVYMW
eukprot:scaffold1302_cov113-Skeletonema_marinoi.AAC.10